MHAFQKFILDVLQAVSTLLKGKPTYVAVGDVATLPYADELGL
jgi:ubiquinol-cytochrome c reductase core subunit 2